MKSERNEISKVNLIIEKSNDGYWISVENLPGCFSYGVTLKEAVENGKEAISEHIAGLKETGAEIPPVFTGIYEISLKYDLNTLFAEYSIINISEFARYVGISASLLRQYSKGLAFAGEKQRQRIEEALHRVGAELIQISL